MSETAPRGVRRPDRAAERAGVRRLRRRRSRRLVGAPAPVRRVRPRRAAATARRPSTPRRTPPPPGTAWCRASSRARTGSGTTATSRWWTGRPSRPPPRDRPTSRCPVRGAECRRTGASTSTDAAAAAARGAARAGLPGSPAPPHRGAGGRRPGAPVRRVHTATCCATPRPGRPARRSGRRRRHLRVDRHPQARPADGRGAAREQPGHARAPRRPRAVAARAAGPPRRRSAGAAAVAGCRHHPRRDGPHRRLPPAGVRRSHRAARRPGNAATPAWCPPSCCGCWTTPAGPRPCARSTRCSSAVPRCRRSCVAGPSGTTCGSSRPTA